MTTPGLREQKKKRTREAIRSAAIDLFERQGYSATTVDQIAAAAEVSPATFFRYFPTKEALVVSDEYDDLFVPTMQAGPPGEPPLEMLRRTFKHVMSQIAEKERTERLRWRHELLLSDPHLRNAIRDLREGGVQTGIEDFARATGRDRNDLRLRLTVRLAIEAMAETVAVWIDRGGKESLPDMIDEAFDALRDGLEL
ncbi:TetR/AcrR family transcriptional regulator [Flindersiella endophytica]